MINKLKDIFSSIIILMIFVLVLLWVYASTYNISFAKSPKAKFYDFQDQIIDGEIKKPTILYTDTRKKVKFENLLKLKKSFIGKLYNTSKEKLFK